MIFYNAPTYTREQLALLDEKEVSFPFSDEDARYIGISHQYELTDKYFQERGVNLQKELDGNEPDKVANFLKELRLKFYSWIYTHNQSSRAQLNYMIAKRGIRDFSPYEYRQAFLEAMFIEGKYLATNGDLSAVSGVDLDQMTQIPSDVMRKENRDMHKDAILLLQSLGLNFYGKYRFIVTGINKEW